MTNDHVAKGFYADDAPKKAGDVVLRFDFESRSDDKTINDVTKHKLHPTDWRIFRSGEANLDFALLRLEKRAGEDVGAGGPRGHLTPAPYNFQEGEVLVILQHPMGAPLKLALGPVGSGPGVAPGEHQGRIVGIPVLHPGTESRRDPPLRAGEYQRAVLMSFVLEHLKALPDADKKAADGRRPRPPARLSPIRRRPCRSTRPDPRRSATPCRRVTWPTTTSSR